MLVGISLAGMLLLAMMSTYLYLGRNLTKLANLQVLEAKSRVALGFLNRDLQMASAVTSPTSSSVVLTLPGGTVTYSYTYPTLSRVATFGAFRSGSLLRADCTAFAFSYYSTTGTSALSGTIVPLSVKRIGVTYTMQRGSSALRTLATLQCVSARVLLRNKALPNGT